MEVEVSTKGGDSFFSQEDPAPRFIPFYLSEDFVRGYSRKKPPWGPIGEFVFLRTYSRWIELGDGKRRKEKWFETIKRVVEGCFTIQKKHCHEHKVPWNNAKSQSSAKIMYELMFYMKFLPPGRGLWVMGTEYIERRGSAALNNCAFVSTKNIANDPVGPFKFLMDMSMLGVGVGFDTKGAGKIRICKPDYVEDTAVIPDTREGWVETMAIVLSGFFTGSKIPKFDYSSVRPKGAPIAGFGGTASGPDPLIELTETITSLFHRKVGKFIISTDIVDVCNMIGKCVVSGNVRRSALISLGDSDDINFMDMKNYKLHPKENDEDGWRWASNNSVKANVGQDYTEPAKRSALNGEPGYLWLENAKAYGRMSDRPNNVDYKAEGMNPCFSGDMELKIFDGIAKNVPLKQLVGKEFKVVTPNNSLVDGKVWKTGVKKTITIKLSNSKELVCTEDHILMTNDGREILAKDCKSERLRSYTEPNRSRRSSLWEKLGFIQGDACLSRLGSGRHKGFEINIGKDDDDIRDLFGFPCDGSRIYYTSEYYDSCIQYGFSSNQLPWRALPKDSEELNENIESFLRGLYSANGSIISLSSKACRIALKSTCLELVNGVKEWLNYMDINSYITTNKPKEIKFKNGSYTCRESYDLNICDRDSIMLFYKYIGFVHKYKNDKLHELVQNKCPLVLSIKDSGEKEVYDFSAKDINWGFVNGVAAHNCGEQTLESHELCCLVETFPSLHESYEEYQTTLKFAYLYAKTVTLIPTHCKETNAVMLRNRRIGTSQSGIIHAFVRHGRLEMLSWCDNGYKYLRELDGIYSDWLCIPRSIKITSVKPSGSVSLLPGVSPGIHYDHSEYQIRRIRVDTDSALVKIMKDAGYPTELDKKVKTATVISFPVKNDNFLKGKSEVTMWEQMLNAVDYQKWWCDNQVSITVTFKEEEARDIPTALSIFDTALKSISFLPYSGDVYPQMPNEEISEKKYLEMVSKLSKPDYSTFLEDALGEKFCDGESCTL